MHRFKLPSPAMVVSMVALFVALGGVGYAAVTLPKASVGSAQLRTAAVTETKIADGAVRSFKIRPNAVSGPKVADNSLTGADILESSLGVVPKVAGMTTVPLTRAVPTVGADAAAARAAAPEIPLFTSGQLSIYGKCLKDTALNQVRAETFARTTADGAIVRGTVDLDGGDGTAFLNVATLELDRRTDSEVAGLNLASTNANNLTAVMPDGTGVRTLFYSGAKNGTLAGPAGQGLYGNGDVCIFGGVIFG